MAIENEATLSELRAWITASAVQDAFDVLVREAKKDPRYTMVPYPQGYIQSLRYMVGPVWSLAFILNRESLLFYVRIPSGVSNSATLALVVGLGLHAEMNNRSEIQIRLFDADDARKLVINCFDRFLSGAKRSEDPLQDEMGRERGGDWTDEELRASVEAYRHMQGLERLGRTGFKKDVYRELANRFARTEKSFEFRMQNISAVLALMGRGWLPGLKPAVHVGAQVAIRIEALINELDGVSGSSLVATALEVRDRMRRKSPGAPEGSKSPARVQSSATTYVRDPAVKAWVLNRARGICECCRQPAPFLTFDGEPFLEVHHLRTLADLGSDTIQNAAAVCPNCHRALHFSRDALLLRERTIAQVGELRAE